MKSYFHYGSLGIMFLIVLFILLVKIYETVDYPKLKSTTCLEAFSQQELNFFSEVGFLFRNSACKWEDDISISLEGEPLKDDGLVIDSIIEELKPLIYPVNISRTHGLGNLVVNFTRDTIDRQVMGFTDTRKMSFNGVISKVEIEIFSKVKGQARQACIRHEFLHALGLTHPMQRNTGTIIEPLVEYIDETDHVKLYKYADLDKSSLKILYSDCLPAGLKKKTFLKVKYRKQ